ncbi:MAG: sulfatase, partial [Phycisphaeraceae bacterium]
MRAVMLMFDSLNRHMLPPYNSDTWVHAPNFQRLAQRCATFETSYIASMPCMPTRRDFHTGRLNFLHAGWGPLEPFDDSVPALLSENGIYTHLDSDHYHYWEDGGATYHTRYDSWQFFRGQEGDPFVGQVADPPIPEHINPKGRRQDWVNRQFQKREPDLSQTQTIDAGVQFIERNHNDDNWFLQVECFDPHEPFVSHRKYKDLYPSDYDGPLLDWPGYREVTETPEQVEEARRNYAALVSKCDASLGDLLDAMDRHELWQDTMLIVWTDHGFMLGEHDCWAKNWMPMYEEVAHTPMFIWDPRFPDAAGQRRKALVQPGIDLGPTLLRYFGIEPTKDMTGRDLAPVLRDDTAVRDATIFGYFGNRLYVTDGRYVYMRDPVTADGNPRFTYSLMPVKMRGFKGGLTESTLAPPFSFTTGMNVLRFGDDTDGKRKDNPEHLLYDVLNDPTQQRTIDDEATERRLCEHAVRLMIEHDAPPEQYVRLGLEQAYQRQTGEAPAATGAQESV